MRNDADYHVRSPRGGKFGSLPASIRTISNYLRSVSANAGSIAASTVRQAAVSAASSGSLNHEDERQREQVQWSNFDKLELGSGEIREVLLLTYLNGFQVWDVQDASNVHELVSRRDGPVAFLRLQPKPIVQEPIDGVVNFKGVRPLLLVVTADGTGSGSPGGYATSGGGTTLSPGAPHFVPTVVRFYSLRNHSYVHTLRFTRGIHAVRCSPRVVAVALATQIYCFDAGTLQNMYSVLTYPSPAPPPGSSHYGYGAMAVGPRWLAYAAHQPLVAITGRVSPQHLTPTASPSTSPANGSFVAHYAKESSKHIVAGVVKLSDMGYKTLSNYYSELMPDSGNASPGVGSPNGHRNGHSPWQGSPPLDPEFAGTVIIRDIVSKNVVAQFRAHSSPLSALSFDPSGTLLVTASVYGHNLNVFRLTPPSSNAGGNGTGGDSNGTFAHLYKLSRGVTNAVIQDISFSSDSHWIAVSSSRGTNHLFAISPFGGPVGPQTHATVPVDGLIGPTTLPSPVFPWWSSTGPVSLSQQALYPPPPAITLNVVNRIRNGNGGWRGTVTSAAVTAAGRPSVLAGAVAAVFHDGGGAGVESDMGVGTLKDQLWILCPTGHLLRYVLRPSVGGDIGGYPVNGLPQMAGMGTPGSPGLPQELKVIVEPVERWDIARRPNWVEREERVEADDDAQAHESEGGAVVQDNNSSSTAPGVSAVGGAAVAKEGSCTTEEMQRWFMSNAEVQMHQARPVPIWAKSKIQFHVMLSGTPEIDDYPGREDGVGEIEIERIPTRMVEVRRKDLVPVIERLQKFTKVQGSRDIMVSDTLPAVSNAHDQLLGDDSRRDEYIDGGLKGMPIQRTSSYSSFGSEGAPFAASGGGMNGYHHGYQDLTEGAVTDTPPSSFGSPPYFPQTQPAGIEPSPTERSEFYQTSFRPRTFTAGPGAAAVTGGSINIPRVEQRDTGMYAGYINKPSGLSTGFPVHSGRVGADSNHDDLHDESVDEGSSGILDAQLGQIGTTPVNDNYMAAATRQLSENLILQENNIGVVQHMRSGVNVSAGRWPNGAQVVANGATANPTTTTTSTKSSALSPEFDPAFVHDDQNRNHVMLSDSPVDGNPPLRDTNVTAEDADSSEDTEGSRSKSEENEIHAEQGDVDVWEGSMFPFCEEDC